MESSGSKDEVKNSRKTLNLKYNHEVNNPCHKEQLLSYKCLDNNNYDYEVCEPVFANYQICRNFWSDVQASRKRKGIRPYLPLPEDRPRVKAEYLKSMNANIK